MHPEAKITNSQIGIGSNCYKDSEVKNSTLGENVIVGNNAIIIDSELESNISINRNNYLLRSKVGMFTYTGIGSSIRSAEVGRFCSLAWNVSIGGGNHNFDRVTTSPLWRFNMLDGLILNHTENKELAKRYGEFGNCVVGHDVWIATNAIIVRGVKIGNGAIIGAGSVVTKDVPPYAIVAGVPAKIIRFRFSDEVISDLEELAWWNWPLEAIREHRELIYNTKVDQEVTARMKEILRSINHG